MKTPIDAQNGVDQGQVFNGNPLSNVEANALTGIEQKSTPKKLQVNAQPDSTPKSSSKDAWNTSGKYYGENSPKKSSQLQSQSTMDSVIDLVGKSGLLPEDPGWDNAEKTQEKRPGSQGISSVMRMIAKCYPERYKELKSEVQPSWVNPAREDDDDGDRFDSESSTAVPTVASKLTVQDFGRPVSPLSYQELYPSGQDPKGWNLREEKSKGFHDIYETVQNDEDELEYLDFYNEKTCGESVLRRIPEEHLHRTLPAQPAPLQGLPGGEFKMNNKQHEDTRVGKGFARAFALTAKHAGQLAMHNSRILIQRKDEEILIQDRRGGLFLHETSYEHFCDIARRFFTAEPSEIKEVKIEQIHIQFRPLGKDPIRTWHLPINTNESRAQYENEILPAYSDRIFRFHVSNFDISEHGLGGRPGQKHIKVIADNVGFYYACVKWNWDPVQNSRDFVTGAIRFLFDIDINKAAGVFMISGASFDWHAIDLSYEVALDDDTQNKFGQLLRRITIPDLHIFREPAYKIVAFNGVNPLDYTPPLSFETFLRLTEEKIFPGHRFSKGLKIAIIHAQKWGLNTKLGPICGVSSNDVRKEMTDRDGNVEKKSILTTEMTKEKWNLWKVTYFKPNESIRIVQCFDLIQVYDGMNPTAECYNWITADIYESPGGFDFVRLVKELYAIITKLLDIDMENTEYRGIQVLENRGQNEINPPKPDYKLSGNAEFVEKPDRDDWIFFETTMPRESILQAFLRVADDRIYIYPSKTEKQIQQEKAQFRWEQAQAKAKQTQTESEGTQTESEGAQTEPEEAQIELEQADSETSSNVGRIGKLMNDSSKKEMAVLEQHRLMDQVQTKPEQAQVEPEQAANEKRSNVGRVGTPMNDSSEKEMAVLEQQRFRDQASKDTSHDATRRSSEESTDSELRPKSLYENPERGLRILKLTQDESNVQVEISGGCDMPTLYTNVMTIPETNTLLQMFNQMEDDSCRVCGIKFQIRKQQNEAQMVAEHYQQHRKQLQHFCPYCSKNWTGDSRRERKDHLESNHWPKNVQPAQKDRLASDHHETEQETHRTGQGPVIEHHTRQKSASLLVPEQEKDEHGRPKKTKGSHYYCSKCFLNLNNKDVKKQKEHVQNCGIALDMILAIPPEEGRRMKKINDKKRQALQQPPKISHLGENFVDLRSPPRAKPKPKPKLKTRSYKGKTKDVEKSDEESSSPTDDKKKNRKRTRSVKPSTSRKKVRG